MRSLRLAVACAALFATAAMATPADPKNGAEYKTLATAQPTQVVGKKIEVLEFFAFHCPACNAMEPYIADFVKQNGHNVNFKKVPFPFTGANDPEAHLYLTLEAMGKHEQYAPKVFHAFHVERNRLTSDAAIMEWVAKSGLDKAKFNEYWSSFGVLTKLRRLAATAESYKITGTPTFVVDGRFVTSPSDVGQANPSMPGTQVPTASNATLVALVNMALKEKGWTNAAPAAAGKPAAK
jgi:thiol:disulfide interchange protein DsbA